MVGILQTRMSNWLNGEYWSIESKFFVKMRLICQIKALGTKKFSFTLLGWNLVLYRPVCKIYTPLPEHRNYWSFLLEIFTNNRSWSSMMVCKISSWSVTWFVFYRPVSILPKMLTFWTTTCLILMKFWQRVSIIITLHWSKFQVHSIFQSWDMRKGYLGWSVKYTHATCLLYTSDAADE